MAETQTAHSERTVNRTCGQVEILAHLYAMGRYLLRGTVRYPVHATPRRSLGRGSEKGTHGWKGDAIETGQFR